MNFKDKICGINNRDNLLQVLTLEPDMVGHIFYSQSLRNLPIEDLVKFQDVDYGRTKKVAVVVNPNLSCLVDLISLYDFKYFQLHGNESVAFCQEIKKQASNLKIIKAFQVGNCFPASEILPYIEIVDYFLFDTKSASYGGSGRSFNWNLLKEYHLDIPYLLSGGINPGNFKKALSFAEMEPKCYGLDLNSGYEICPGMKSIELLRGRYE